MSTTLTITARGPITRPSALRNAAEHKAKDRLIAEATAHGILLRSARAAPLEMYFDDRIHEFDSAEADLAMALAVDRKR